jgi:hypothetical protein
MAFTKAQLEALKNSLLASGQPINAATHRELVQKLIDELYDAQSRGDLLSSVQATATTQAGDVVLVIRSGQAYLIPATEFGAAGIALGDLTNTVIVDPQDGDVLAYNAVTEKWENISSDLGATAVPYTGAVGSVNLGEFGLSAGFLKLDTTPTGTPTDAGTMFWDEDDQTVDIRLNGYVMKIGEDLFYPVKNQTGSSIPKGTAVRFAGTLGSSGRLLIEPFLADGSQDSRNFMGVTAEAIADGADGKVLWFGRIRGIDTSAFSEGDILYASPSTAGSFTATRPTFPENIISVAAVINDSATQGVIFVRPRTEFLQGGGSEFYIPAFDSNGNLIERNWRVDSNGVLIASGTSGIISIRNVLSGENVHAILSNIYLKSTGIIFNTAANNPVPGSNSRYSKAGNFIFASADTDTNDIFVKYMYSASSLFTAWKKLLVSLGTSGQIGFYNSAGQVIGDSGFIWDNANKRLGVGTATPSYAAHVRRSGDARVYCETSSDNGLAYVGTISDVANVQLAAFGSNYPAPWAGKSGVYLDPGQNDFNVWFGNKLVSAIDNNGNTRASTFYSEKITVTLSTNGVDVDVKTFAATDKKIFRATAIPTDNTDLYALADFSKLYDGTNSVFRRTSLAGSNMALDVDGLNGSILQARATSATGENKEIEVSIIYYV